MRLRTDTRRSRLWLLLPLVAVAGVALYLADPQRRLALRFEIGARLAPYSRVVELEVEQAPGLKMFLNPDDSVLTWWILRDRLWEANETYWISRMLDEGDTFVDVGANVGYYTLVASRIVGPRGRVYAFEPDPVAFEILRRNVLLNGLENVVLEQKALSNENGTIQLFLAEENKGDHRIYRTEEDRVAIDVEAVTLDDYARSIDGPIDVIKLDTQGAEGFILQGMPSVLERNPDLVLAIEFWPHVFARLFDVRALVEMLRGHDFLFFNLGAGGGVHAELPVVSDFAIDRWLRPPIVEEEGWFTNLLLVRGRRRMEPLLLRVLAAQRALTAAKAGLEAAQAAWEQERRAQLEAGSEPDEALPLDVATALRLGPTYRVPFQEELLAGHFASTTPLLDGPRAELEAAVAAVGALRAELLRGARADGGSARDRSP